MGVWAARVSEAETWEAEAAAVSDDDSTCQCAGTCRNPKPGEICREADADIIYVRRTTRPVLWLGRVEFLGDRPPNVKPALDFEPGDDEEL